MTHQGGAAGGHYYAYIKSFEDGNWYEFNDTCVTQRTEKDVRKTFGSSNTTANAYMLCYRLLDKERVTEISDELVPDYVRKELEEENEEL